jgi:hypothetical protein
MVLVNVVMGSILAGHRAAHPIRRSPARANPRSTRVGRVGFAPASAGGGRALRAHVASRAALA